MLRGISIIEGAFFAYRRVWTSSKYPAGPLRRAISSCGVRHGGWFGAKPRLPDLTQASGGHRGSLAGLRRRCGTEDTRSAELPWIVVDRRLIPGEGGPAPPPYSDVAPKRTLNVLSPD